MQSYDGIKMLLNDVSRVCDKLHGEYENAKKDSSVKQIMFPAVKSSLEHLRSCLEYCAQEIGDRYCGPMRKGKRYFPYGKNQSIFEARISENLALLKKTKPSIYRLILGLQPFSAGDKWLSELCDLTNTAKHIRPLTFDRENSKENVTRVLNGLLGITEKASLTFDGLTIRGKQGSRTFHEAVTINGSESESDIRQKLSPFSVNREYENVKFKFTGSPEDALDLIKRSHCHINIFVENLKSEMI